VETIEIIGIILGSSVLTAFVTALFTRKAHEETISLKYITEERAKWRENIKETMTSLSWAVNLPHLNGERLDITREKSTYLRLSLNPYPNHELDKDILLCLKNLCSDPCYEQYSVLEEKVSLLLKHDWERAKNEVITPLSGLISFTILTGLVWGVFDLFIRETSIYTSVQEVPYFAGNYTEIASSLGAITLSVILLTYGKKEVVKLRLDNKIKKLNKPYSGQATE